MSSLLFVDAAKPHDIDEKYVGWKKRDVSTLPV
jgi:hypothetical protein